MSVNLLTDFQGNQLPLANDNLLINSDFRNPINQRGQTSYTADATYNKVYSVDRWAVTYRGKVTVNDGYITVENTNTNPGATQVEAYFVQQFENTLNDDLVLQVKVKSITGDVKVFGYALEAGLNVFTSDSSISRGNITFVIGYGASVELEYIKLEYGTVATPLVPRLYAEELYLCKRYCLVLSDKYTLGTVSLANTNTCYCALKHHLRSTPTLTYDGGVVVNQNGQTTTVANITLDNELSDSENLFLYLKCSTGNTFSSIYCGFAYCQDAGRKLIFDSEIK